MLSTLLRPRWLNLLGFLACVVAMLFALYLQEYQNLEPCPLCIFQRVAVMFAALFFLLPAAHNPGPAGVRVYGVLSLAGGLAGIGLAWRHVWLQGLPPDQVPACGPDLGYMLDVFPFHEVLSTVLTGSGECATIDWSFLGVSLPGWTLLMFIGLSALSLLLLVRPRSH